VEAGKFELLLFPGKFELVLSQTSEPLRILVMLRYIETILARYEYCHLPSSV